MTTKKMSPLTLGGLTSSETGELEQRGGPDFWWSPLKIETDDVNLFYLQNGFHHSIRPGRRLLEDFISLREASAQEIVKYGTRWGILDLCRRHNLPCYFHSLSLTYQCPLSQNCLPCYKKGPLAFVDQDAASTWRGSRLEIKPREFFYQVVPVTAWRSLATQLGAILEIASKIHEGKIDKKAEWKKIDGVEKVFGCGIEYKGVSRCVQGPATTLIQVVIETLVEISALRPRFTWSGRPRIALGATSLFDALVLQTILAISKLVGIAVCSGCGKFHLRTRRPRADRATYCLECGRKAAVRAASARYREKSAR